jgi:hypothetical protein
MSLQKENESTLTHRNGFSNMAESVDIWKKKYKN